MTESRILASRDFPAVSLLTLCKMNGVTSLPMMPCSLRNNKDNEIKTSKIHTYILGGIKDILQPLILKSPRLSSLYGCFSFMFMYNLASWLQKHYNSAHKSSTRMAFMCRIVMLLLYQAGLRGQGGTGKQNHAINRIQFKCPLKVHHIHVPWM